MFVAAELAQLRAKTINFMEKTAIFCSIDFETIVEQQSMEARSVLTWSRNEQPRGMVTSTSWWPFYIRRLEKEGQCTSAIDVQGLTAIHRKTDRFVCVCLSDFPCRDNSQ